MTMSPALLKGIKRLWNAWNIRGCILLSLLLQTFLHLSAPLRKRQRKKPLLGLIWLAYLLWDWLDTIAIGLISRNKGGVYKLKDVDEDFMALWASFLLLHLGGPDAITSFAIEDNQFWLRQLTALILQVLSTAYIIYLSFPRSKIWISTAMVFLAGTIKYAERARALYLASLDRIGTLEQRKAYHGLDYEQAVRSRYPASLVDVSEHAGVMPTEVESAEDSECKGDEKDLKLLQDASRFFDMLKGFIVGTVFSSVHREESRRYFLNRNSTQAFRLIEYELSFMYDLLHTKFVMLLSRSWIIFRVVCIFLIFGAFTAFRSIEKRHDFHSKFDVNLSYALLMGALCFEIINALIFLFSDWAIMALNGAWREFLSTFFMKQKMCGGFLSVFLVRKRWCKFCSQYDMISYCLNRPPTWLSKLAASVSLGETLDKMRIWDSSHSMMVEEDLEEFIFEQLKKKSEIAKNLQAGKAACSQRGDRALVQNNHGFKLKWSIDEYEYGESLLLWHVATEILYQTDPKSFDKICKLLSDYMFHLFVMEPILMAPVFGGWETAFEDTCAETRRFFSRKGLEGLNQQKACQEILEVKTPVRPNSVKGSSCKSVLFDASILAKQLLDLGDDRRKVMRQVWMELMSYAAINCRPILHAQQLSRGGELLTLVWLLMNHLGLGTQFYEYEHQSRTKMISLN